MSVLIKNDDGDRSFTIRSPYSYSYGKPPVVLRTGTVVRFADLPLMYGRCWTAGEVGQGHQAEGRVFPVVGSECAQQLGVWGMRCIWGGGHRWQGFTGGKQQGLQAGFGGEGAHRDGVVILKRLRVGHEGGRQDF